LTIHPQELLSLALFLLFQACEARAARIAPPISCPFNGTTAHFSLILFDLEKEGLELFSVLVVAVTISGDESVIT
jgi:hypothetical protein